MLAGLAVLVVLIPVNGWVANQVKKLQVQQMEYKDKRVKMMNEILNGMKVSFVCILTFSVSLLPILNK